MVIHGDTGFHPAFPGQNPAYRSTPRHHPPRSLKQRTDDELLELLETAIPNAAPVILR